MRRTICVAVLLLTQLVPVAALASPGDLDLGFSDDGIVITDVADESNEGHAIAIDAAGRIVVAGGTETPTGTDVLVLRYLMDGTLDTSFGGDGVVTTPTGGDGGPAFDVAIDGEGRIVVGAMGSKLIRYQPNGTLDPSFGDSGIATIDILTPRSLAIDSSDNIVVAGGTEASGQASLVARYEPDGSLDSGFGDGGSVTTPRLDLAWSVLIDNQGKIVVGGSDFLDLDSYDGMVARYLTNGDPDPSFSGDGVAVVDTPHSLFVADIALDNDDNIVVAGFDNHHAKVLRLTPTGARDSSFATNGEATTDVDGDSFSPESVAVDRHSNIVIGGGAMIGLGEPWDFAVARYRHDGSLDSNFSGDGIATTHVSDSNDQGRALAVDNAGNILLAGHGTADGDVVVARYEGYRPDDRFVDDDDSIFESGIEWLAAEGITQGCNPPLNDMYCPNEFVTRGQMAAFLVRAVGYTDNGGGDLFTDDNDSIFEAAIDKLGTAGVTQGCNPPANDMYCPNEFVTRGQMAAFLSRALRN
jgi:uncharacterized delta-60 repeat protein